MMTFSEALTRLKAGRELRQSTWPLGWFVRSAKTTTGPTLRQFKPGPNKTTTSALYVPTQPELFNQSWEIA